LDPETADSSRWFLTELEPHRPALRAWLLARFPTMPDVDDLVQESFARVMRARETGPVRSARALVFATARNLAFDTLRRQSVVTFEPVP
jgi:DNA-directed RNA polymerase specialized sigma24 family protein